MVNTVFIPRKHSPQRGVNIASILGNKEVKGEVGIEIEVEGKSLPSGSTPLPWVYHVDHSLRGECAEYVLHKPIPFKDVEKSLGVLWEGFKLNKTKIHDSNRTSVHVHLNVQQWHLNRLTSFLGLYFILEDILTEWCGEYRVGNLFCLRAKDAPAIITYTKKFIAANGEAPIHDFLHYSALNTNALKKFGSLEIRTLRGCSEPTVILDWISVLERLYTLSEEYPDPREICTSLSSLGALMFFEKILGPELSTIRQGIPHMTDNDIADSIIEGVRIAQDLCYCRDWDLYEPIKIKDDPWKRGKSKIAQKLLHQSVVLPGEEVLPPGLNAGFLSASPGYHGPTGNPMTPFGTMPTPDWAPELPDFEDEPEYDDIEDDD